MNKPTTSEMVDFINSDLLNDARCSRLQAENGPFFPEKDITKESLLAYAEDCERKAARNKRNRGEIIKKSVVNTLQNAAPFPIWNYC